jgi:hypothetical protein
MIKHVVIEIKLLVSLLLVDAFEVIYVTLVTSLASIVATTW